MIARGKRIDVRLFAWAALAGALNACRLSSPDDRLEPSYTPLWLTPGGTRYLGVAPGGRLVAVDLATGETAWTFELTKESNPFGARHQALVCPPVLMATSILVRETEELVVLDAVTGNPTHREQGEPAKRFGSRVCPVMLEDDSFVFAVDEGRRLRCGRLDGSEAWSVELPGDERAVGPVRKIAGDDIAVRTKNRILVWSSNGRLQRSAPLSDYAE
jgi:outer membrane protein assembly factor BamB